MLNDRNEDDDEEASSLNGGNTRRRRVHSDSSFDSSDDDDDEESRALKSWLSRTREENGRESSSDEETEALVRRIVALDRPVLTPEREFLAGRRQIRILMDLMTHARRVRWDHDHDDDRAVSLGDRHLASRRQTVSVSSGRVAKGRAVCSVRATSRRDDVVVGRRPPHNDEHDSVARRKGGATLRTDGHGPSSMMMMMMMTSGSRANGHPAPDATLISYDVATYVHGVLRCFSSSSVGSFYHAQKVFRFAMQNHPDDVLRVVLDVHLGTCADLMSRYLHEPAVLDMLLDLLALPPSAEANELDERERDARLRHVHDSSRRGTHQHVPMRIAHQGHLLQGRVRTECSSR